MLLNEWELNTFSQLGLARSLIYCQETIYLDDTTVLGIIEFPSTSQHGFKVGIISQWTSVTNNSNYIAKEVM